MNLIISVVLAVLAVGCGPQLVDYKQEQVLVKGEKIIISLTESRRQYQYQSQSRAVAVAEIAEVWEQRGNRHPEQGADEVFETNCEVENFGRIPYRTKRAGKVAYWRDGREIGGLGGKRYIPVFVSKKEWFTVHAMKVEKKFPFHFWTRNHYFADATVTLIGIEGNRSDGREIKRTFQLKREKSLGNSWEAQMIVPGDFCIMEIVVKPKGKKEIKFLAYQQVRGGGRVNILLSSCPLPETFARPRLTIFQPRKAEVRVWPTTFQAPENIPGLYQ
ncbi:MAG: hypothetical protein PHP25_02620 [Candidatus Moranbacteria bacterium]|nr:hypothetical protein [Candidatus Moranbacteria bacterium]